jgi:DNA-binding IclR family transcriptional regulator
METEKRSGSRAGNLVRVHPPGERSSLSRSATRALDILEFFGQVQRPLRAIEISRALNFGPSTTNQLLKTMVESAHLTFDASTKSYLPSPRLARFGVWMVANYGANQRLQNLISEVQRESGETVTLSTPNDIFMQIVDLAGSRDSTETAVRGLRISIFGSIIGTAYLSALADTEIAKLATRARIRDGDLADIREAIKRVRQDGVGDGPNGEGEFWSIAAPLARQNTLTPLVLGLAGPTARIRQNIASLRELMRRATADAMNN